GRRAHPGGAGGQPLPPHRVPEHPPDRAGRRAEDAARRGGNAGDPSASHPISPAGGDQGGRYPATTSVQERELERARRRKEDARLITGRTRWTDNITPAGTLHLAILRSPVAHARITSIDTEEARRMSGVEAVITGRDVADEQGSLPCAWPITEDMKHPAAPALAVDTVRFAGEAVAVVAARSAAEARDALDAIDVEYEDLPVVLDMESALQPDSPLVHPDLGTNRNATWTFDSAEAGTGGDVEQALADAEVRVERTFRQQRLI